MSTTITTDNNSLPPMPSIIEYFKKFSTEHSWYKHIPIPQEFAIELYRDEKTGQLKWSSYFANQVLSKKEKDHQLMQDERVRATVKSNTWWANALVYDDDHGFNHTVSIGGDKWFAWIDTIYPDDAKWLRKCCKRSPENPVDDVKEPVDIFNRGRRWQLSIWEMSEEDKKITKEYIRALKAKEYKRMFQEFQTKAEKIWQTYIETLK